MMEPPPDTPRQISRRRLLIGAAAGAVALPVVAGAAYLATHRVGTHGTPPPVRISFGQREIATAAWSPDGARIASIGGDATVRVWDAATGKPLLTCALEGAGAGVYPQGVAWSADGRALMAFFGEYTHFPGNDQFVEQLVNLVQVWDAETGHPVRNFHVLPPATITGAIAEAGKSHAYSHVRSWAMNERFLAVTVDPATSTPTARLGAAHVAAPLSPTPTPLPTPTPPRPTATPLPSATLTPSATPTPGPPSPPPTVSSPETIEIWELATGRKVATLDPSHQSGDDHPTTLYQVVGLVWAPDSKKLAVYTLGQPHNQWQLWDVATGQLTRTFPVVYGTETVLAWSPDARSLAAGTTIYDVATGHQEAAYTPSGTLVTQAWSPDGARLAVSTYAATRPGLYSTKYSLVSLIDTASGRLITQYDQGENSAILGDHTLAWSPDGKELLVVRDGAEIWRVG